jgi:hypothetical protein
MRRGSQFKLGAQVEPSQVGLSQPYFRLPEQFAQSENGPGVLEVFVPVAEKDLVQHLDG